MSLEGDDHFTAAFLIDRRFARDRPHRGEDNGEANAVAMLDAPPDQQDVIAD